MYKKARQLIMQRVVGYLIEGRHNGARNMEEMLIRNSKELGSTRRYLFPGILQNHFGFLLLLEVIVLEKPNVKT